MTERVYQHLVHFGCATIESECGAKALADLGGLYALANESIDAELEAFKSNPRSITLENSIRRRLALDTSNLVRRCQRLVSSVKVSTEGQFKNGISSSISKSIAIEMIAQPLPFGAHTEAWVTSKDPNFVGRIDLLLLEPTGATIVDFKSGKHSHEHEDQLLIYGALWQFDSERNPNTLPVKSLQIVYITEKRKVEIPGDWSATLQGLRERIAQASKSLSHPIPPTNISIEQCKWCSVRALCSEYWGSDIPDVRFTQDVTLSVDLEIIVEQQRGPNLWEVHTIGGPKKFQNTKCVICIRHPVDLASGGRYRLLDFLFSDLNTIDDEVLPHSVQGDLPFFTSTVHSEVYQM